MEFQRERVYSAVNADELKPGDKVIVANNLADLKEFVKKNDIHEIEDILSDCVNERFGVCGMANYALAYLVERAENCTNCERLGKTCNSREDDKITCCFDYKPKTKQKAEPHYRPLRDTDELIKVWREKSKQVHSEYSLTMPYIWLRRKEVNSKGQLITEFGDELHVSMGKEGYNMTDLFVHFTFLDGSPCGVEA